MAIIERSQVIEEAAAFAQFQKAGAVVANDFANQCVVGSLAIDTTNGQLYQCTATNGTTTATWVKVGTQA